MFAFDESGKQSVQFTRLNSQMNTRVKSIGSFKRVFE